MRYLVSLIYSRTPLVKPSAIFNTINGKLRFYHSSTMATDCKQSMDSKSLTTVTKSEEDKRLYRALEYSNKLKVLLISDAATEKSAAALDVNVGSMCDPDNVPGLAHFCEHMLFLGTKKFPEENEYAKYLCEHGGSCNAFTSNDHTQYFFDVLPEHFSGALDRFSQFFLSPLFTESATSREVKAVDSEHEKNLPSDSWRLLQLDKHNCREGHDYRKFGTGNVETLETIPVASGLNVRSQLLEFHDKWYSANTMALAVVGRESLDELEALVSPLFSSVVNKEVDAPKWLDHPVGAQQMKKQAFVVPVQDLRSLSVSFPIPDYHDRYKAAPGHYFSHLVGHEGPGSLLSALKSRGWVNSLSCGASTPAKGFSNFNIFMDLTVDGIENVQQIVTLLFQYINLLRKDGLQEWIFNECKQLNAINFRFKDKETPYSYVGSIARNLHSYPLEEALVGPYLISEWRPDYLQEVLDLLVPSRVRIAVVGKKFEGVADLEEPWYKTKYRLETIPEKTIQEWENCGLCDELQMPSRNIFIPTNLDIIQAEENKNGKVPALVHNTEFSRLWYKQDDVYLLPKAVVKFELRSPLAYLDPLNASLTYMFTALVKDDLNEYSYDADLAGLDWGLSGTKHGIEITVGGYSDKLKVLFEKVVDKITNFTVNEKRFDLLKEIYVRGLKNFALKQPYEQMSYYMGSLLSEHSWTKQDLLEVVDQVTPAALRELVPLFLRRAHTEGLIYGNVSLAGALAVKQCLEERLASQGLMMPLQPRQLMRGREIELEDGSHYLFETRNEVHKSSCTGTYLQCGVQTTQTNIELELLGQIACEPFFNILRTKEQLGYIVRCDARRANGAQGLSFMVQSNKHPDYLLSRIEAFVVHLREMLVSMSDEEFEKHREAHAALKLEKPKKMFNQARIFWSEIISQQYHFNRAEVEVAYLRTVSKDQLLTFFDKYITNSAPQRHQMTIFVVSDAEGGAGGEEVPQDWTKQTPQDSLQPPATLTKPTKIEDASSFKSSHGLYPLAQPYIQIPRLTKSKL